MKSFFASKCYLKQFGLQFRAHTLWTLSEVLVGAEAHFLHQSGRGVHAIAKSGEALEVLAVYGG